jgi:DNA-binding response OmpR family regulator
MRVQRRDPEMHKILLVEDDPNLGFMVQEHLQLNGYEVTLCVNGKDGLAAFEKGHFDLCLADIMMPQMDGFTFAGHIRRQDPDVPLIFLTAKSLKEDKIEGFKIGCDDYITKPFSVEELLLRIQAVLRRAQGTNQDDGRVEFEIGRFTFNSSKQILIGKNQTIKLTSRESELLRLLCLHLNRTLERNMALRQIWGDESYFSGRSMDVFVSKLRKYLKDDPRVEIINVHGKGYKLIISS